MVLFAWLIAIAGFAGGSWIIYRKFIAPEQSMWEGIGDWFGSKDIFKAEKRKEKLTEKGRGHMLEELKSLHDDKAQFDMILQLLEKNELTLDEFKLLSQFVGAELKIVQGEFKSVTETDHEMKRLLNILRKESKTKEPQASQDVRRDWKEEYEICQQSEEEIKILLPIIEKEVKSLIKISIMLSRLEKEIKDKPININVEKDLIKELREGRELRKKLEPNLKQKLEELRDKIGTEQADIYKAAA